jgi:GNAT superfamily N-acetyltransferase
LAIAVVLCVFLLRNLKRTLIVELQLYQPSLTDGSRRSIDGSRCLEVYHLPIICKADFDYRTTKPSVRCKHGSLILERMPRFTSHYYGQILNIVIPENCLFVSQLLVNEHERRKGIASQLMAIAMKEIDAMWALTVVNSSDDSLKRFFMNFEFYQVEGTNFMVRKQRR